MYSDIHRRASLLALGLVVALGACSSEPQADASPSSTSQPSAAVPEQASNSPTTPVASGLADTSSIPPLLRGRWGLVPLDCTGDPAAAKGLITVGPQSIRFYEAEARLGTIAAISESAVTAPFAFEGEGQSWTLDVTLQSPDGGKTLVRRDKGPDAAPAPLTYGKCP